MRLGECTVGCGACCRFISVNVNPQYFTNLDVKKWVELHGIRVRMVSGIAWMDIPLACTALRPDGTCSLHGTEDYPDTCKTFPSSQADITLVHELVGEEVCTYSFTEGE